MKRTITTLAMLVALASAALAQTNTYPTTGSTTNRTDTLSSPTLRDTRGNTPNVMNSTNRTNSTNGTNGTNETNGTSEVDNTRDNNLPRTASPLPYVLFGGLLALGCGLWLSRRRLL